VTSSVETTEHFPGLLERVRQQRVLQPDLYGDIDFDRVPLRFTTDPDVVAMLPDWVDDRQPLLDDPRLVELIRTATMLGDVDADPYAALIPQYGVQGLIDMLRTACREGVDAVPDAPEELRRFIDSMATVPDWVDLDLVEEGARYMRVSAAFFAPFITRGAFLATFLNTYAALPMALTGALTGEGAGTRVIETTRYFAETTFAGSLTREGGGFEASAMVRLMHSVVRYSALKRSSKWDLDVYGIPVPQIDQMPAGMINMYTLAIVARRSGRTEFHDRERAMLEYTRYRCFLLGLPEELLPTTCQGIIEMFHGRAAMLRDDFDETCHQLVTATMGAYLRQGHTPWDRAAEAVERSWSKLFFLGFCNFDRKEAAAKGAPFEVADMARIAATAPFVFGRFLSLAVASTQPPLKKAVDRYAVRVLNKRLVAYGKAEYTTHGARH